MINSQFTIVVADDIPEIVHSVSRDIARLAEKYNKKVRILQANSGSEVIKFADNETVDAFYIDYKFEYGMNGDEIIDNIQDPFSNKFFVLMSGWKENELVDIITKSHHRRKSQCKFIKKPYDSLTFQSSFLEMFSFFERRLYPLPIQYEFTIVQNSKEGISRAWAIRDFFETLIKYSVSILMADMQNQKDYLAFRVKIKPNSNLTYGAWLRWLSSLIDFYKNKTDSTFIPELIQFFESNSATHRKIIEDFKDVRDNELGHGHLKDDKWYEIIANDFEEKFNSMYKDLQFLSKYILIFPEKSEILANESEGYKYQLTTLMGSEMMPSKIELVTNLRLLPNNIYIYSPSGKALSLSPLIAYELCAKCGAMKFYFLDRIQPTFITYNSFCDHRVEVKEAKAQFDQRYSFIFSNGQS